MNSSNPKKHSTKPEMCNKANAVDLDDLFESFMRHAYSSIPAHTVQYRESRRVFFAGVATLLHLLKELAPLEPDEAETILHDVDRQLYEFFEQRVAQDKD